MDNIDHAALLARLPMVPTTLRRWLKAGGGELGHYPPTEAGTPQGGVGSPLLANSAVDGMERRCDGADTRGHPQRPSWKTGQNTGISRLRYAADLVVVAPSREGLAQHVLPTLAAFLRGRGLQLSEAQPRIGQSTEGGNFLGCEIKRYTRALWTQPQQAKVYGHYHTIKTYLKQHKQSPAAQRIRGLNPQRRGGANYDRHCAAKRAFRNMAHLVWHALWKGAQRRHPQKPAQGVHQRYCRTVGNRQGGFAAGKAQILWYQDTPSIRMPKGKGKASPMPPDLKTYWEQRGQWRLQTLTIAKQRKSRLQAQDFRGGLGQTLFYYGDPLDDHPIKPQQQGGEDRKENRMLVQQWCHHAHHQRHGYKAAGA